MTVYNILLATILIGGYLCFHKFPSKPAKAFFYIIVISQLILISSLRFNIGFDYDSYLEIYSTIGTLSWGEVVKSYPMYLGYALWNKLISITAANYTAFLFITNTIITAIISYVAIKYSKLPWLSFFIYVAFQFFAHSMNLFRQSIAATIFLLAFTALKEKKFFRYLIIVLIAASFHVSALILIPVYFFVNIRFTKKLWVPVGAMSLIVYIFSNQVFDLVTKYIFPNFIHYKDSIYWNGNGISFIIVPTIYFLMVLLSKNVLIRDCRENNVLINMAFLTFINYVFITKHFILERFAIYFFIFAIITIPIIWNSLNVPILVHNVHAIKIKKHFEEIEFYQNLIISTTILVGLGYMVFAATKGFHSIYPYISLFAEQIT